MIDFAEIRLIVKDDFIVSSNDDQHFALNIDLFKLGIPLGCRDCYLDEQGNIQHAVLFHPYDQLPTSYTNVAFKLVHEGKIKPHVMIKCSPAKIMQGHNVFGSDDLETGIFEMLGYLAESQPELYNILDIENAQIVALDVTYSARLKNDDQVCQVLDFLRNVSNGSLRKSKMVYGTTVYWGSPNSKRLARKAYCKAVEYMRQLDKLKRQAGKGDVSASRILKAMDDSRVIAFMQGLLRLETRFKPVWLFEHDIPLNVFDLIDYQRKHPKFLTELWQLANKPLFESLEGHTMKALDHDTVFSKICAVFDTYTQSGRLSQTKSRNLFNFFCALEMHGAETLKRKYSKTRYYAYISDLMECGFSKAYLQNLQTDSKTNVIPFVQLIKIDFENQVPDWYVEPQSRFAKVG